jgi:hypothetical protein
MDSMKNMLIAAAVVGSAIAGLVLLSSKKLNNTSAKDLRDKARLSLFNSDGQGERSPLQTMG